MRNFLCIALVTAVPVVAQVTFNDIPSREFGHPLLNFPPISYSPNLVEGRELSGPSGIAFDYSVTPPAVYIADTGNNRVLVWKNSAALASGAKADFAIGQRDLVSTLPQGPGQTGSTLSTGLYFPVGVAVDSKGNLYVIDSGNNRVLRYPTPLAQAGGLFPVDLVIGQKSVSGSANNQPNEGNGQTPSNKTLYFSVNRSTFFRAGLTFDSLGNLWVTDPGNNRVLRFPAANLIPNNPEPPADLVLGQNDFVSFQGPQAPNNTQISKIGLVQPAGLAFDSTGRLYVADAGARVMEYLPPSVNGQTADRVLGIQPPPQLQGQQPTPYPDNYTLGNRTQTGQFNAGPDGVFTVGPNLFVCDTPQHRVVRYDVPSNWPGETIQKPSPEIASSPVIGQPDRFSGKPNGNHLEPTSSSLQAPVAGAFNTATNEVWIVDSSNNRVLVFPQQGALQYSSATRVLGQTDFPFNSPNLIEGREVFFANGGSTLGGGIVVDKNSTPPHLYVADTGNNRVLGFLDARNVGTDARALLTQKADLVIGQPDLFRSLQNYSPANLQPVDVLTPNNTGLILPTGLAVDRNGNLFVADSGNGRVLRFPQPFAQPPGTLARANLVLGQSSFTSKIQDPSSSTMSTPFGLAIFNDGSLAVSDYVHSRVLVFQKPAGSDFTSGQAAAVVLGQRDFNSIGTGSSPSSLNGPRHIATDSSDGGNGNDRLYVCDTLNNRVLVFTNASKSSNGASAALVIPGLSQPQGVTVSTLTGESWVTNTLANIIYRFPEFTTLQGNPTPTFQLSSPGPAVLALDQFDNLVVGEISNRISFYFPRMYYRHAATFAAGVGGSPVNLAPGMLALLGRYGTDFSFTPSTSQSLPWPTAGLNDVQLMVNGVPAPIFLLEAAVIHFQVPMSAPQTGTADFVVLKPSTGQILAAATFGMQQGAPGIFTANQAGTGQAAAQNIETDGSITINSGGNAVARGGFITLWLTGAGVIPNSPPDGTAPGGALPTPVQPKVFINALAATNIQYSGTSPQFPGLWQINVQVPMTVPPGSAIPVLVTMYDYQSNIGGTSAAMGGPGPDRPLQFGPGTNNLIPTIAVK